MFSLRSQSRTRSSAQATDGRALAHDALLIELHDRDESTGVRVAHVPAGLPVLQGPVDGGDIRLSPLDAARQDDLPFEWLAVHGVLDVRAIRRADRPRTRCRVPRTSM